MQSHRGQTRSERRSGAGCVSNGGWREKGVTEERTTLAPHSCGGVAPVEGGRRRR